MEQTNQGHKGKERAEPDQGGREAKAIDIRQRRSIEPNTAQ